MRKKVMIVEDEGLIANDIAGQLGKSGYEVAAISSSGEEALALLQNTAPDLVLMDIRLKGKLDGIDTAERVRVEHNLPVIFLTSHADADTLARAKRAEPFGYLVKPFRQLNLCSAIEMALYKHETERALAQREAWLATVLQSTPDPTIVTDPAGKVQFLNAAAEQLLGAESSGAIGRTWTEAVPLFEKLTGAPAEDLAPLALLKTATLKLPRGLTLRKQDGSEVEIEGEVSPSMLKGALAGAVITIRDVSERNREELEVRHEQKMLAVGRLAGGLANEFNNLMTVILGYGTELASGLRSPQDLRMIQALLQAAGTAAGVARQLLILSCNQATQTEILPVNDSVRRVADALAVTVGPSIRLRMDLAGDTGQVRMNPANLDQLLTNLILNSRDALRQGGEIVVSASRSDRVTGQTYGDLNEQFVRLMVADNGTGIPAEIQEHIFEPFFTTKPHGKSAGLGLAVAYGIVKEAGGEITVRSTPGSGSCFEILLPRIEEPRQAPVSSQPAGDSSGVKTVLLVEEQDAVRTLVHNYLENKGFNLIEAADGEEALALAELYEGSIDVLISNWQMPKMDGGTLSRQLAASRPNVKALFLAAHAGEAVGPLPHSGPQAGFLAKPFALPALLEKVHHLAA